MPRARLPLPSYEGLRNHVYQSLSPYWSRNSLDPSIFPGTSGDPPPISGPLRLEVVQLPPWARECGVEGALLVPVEACRNGNDWQRVDWWLAAFLLLECWHERVWELEHGPIHSYSFRLQHWDVRAWEYAWVNRIAMFLRAWAANRQGKDSAELFGEVAPSQLVMTHDVDAVAKSASIRLKQGAFNLLNAARHLIRAQPGRAAAKVVSAARFFFGRESWWTFEDLLAEERNAGIRAEFNFYADERRKSLKRWLFDPQYDLRDDGVRPLLRRIREENGVIGLHPSFDAWQSAELIDQQRQHLAGLLGGQVVSCRQHWLRFGWARTWSAQERAGIERDTTLMFNDRPGFRASSALVHKPWDQENGCAHRLSTLPTIMMDSHFYDYQTMGAAERSTEIRRWIGETQAVGGQAAILWHPHTLTDDYGWADGFHDVLSILRPGLETPVHA